ncbi:peptidoglycan/LPS O-acetylase OafA/YrhL [Roseimicrobium gellanilyticum]|uniref:Peptidoglycan/LPS O-acetylase OafA/YrhL n=1 Tax=Roseimicrobium gellanilyticum TaxID=748857 RepID=A0A366HV06_9BACT|nr:acyltransferase [Roseimicrobium gellanilyticum]RBP48121.1 peptidoglycan/LPS O-acetylase OafA/YrhL [Roseimicrobium gellanilyticum]
MGHFRLLLALLVVVAHTVPPKGLTVIHGEVAVRLFFAVSGFYMAMILAEKYREGLPGRLWLFYSNRALRIFPLLWVALLVEVVLGFILLSSDSLPSGHWLADLRRLSQEGHWGLLSAYAGTQLSGFGVDSFFLFSLSPDLVPSLYTGKVEGFIRGWRPLPLAHAWSISCELCFYLAAPLLTRLRTWGLALVLLGSMLLVVALPKLTSPSFATVAGSFWFPMQFGYFVLGILSYRLYRGVQNFSPSAGWTFVQIGIVTALGLSIAFYTLIASVSHTLSQVLLYGLAALAIPSLFQWSARSKWDRAVGELSYPVYLLHITVKTALLAPWTKSLFGTSIQNSFVFMLTTMAISCGMSWLVLRLIDLPINQWRQSRVLDAHPRRSG